MCPGDRRARRERGLTRKTATVNAVGDRVELEYESKSNILPSSESVQVGGGTGPDDWVTFTAQCDLPYVSTFTQIDGPLFAIVDGRRASQKRYSSVSASRRAAKSRAKAA